MRFVTKQISNWDLDDGNGNVSYKLRISLVTKLK